MKIKPSNNALCEDERIAREDCMYKLEELKDIISITVDGETYKVPWKEQQKGIQRKCMGGYKEKW